MSASLAVNMLVVVGALPKVLVHEDDTGGQQSRNDSTVSSQATVAGNSSSPTSIMESVNSIGAAIMVLKLSASMMLLPKVPLRQPQSDLAVGVVHGRCHLRVQTSG